MQYVLMDIETGCICANFTELVNMQDDPRSKAIELVNEMNTNLVKSGDGVCFKLLEVDDNIKLVNFRTYEDEIQAIVNELSTHTWEERYLFAEATGTTLMSDSKKVKNLCNYRGM